MSSVKTNVEYEEAPSGNVYFYNYKEPLMRFPDGYGFAGALVFDGDTDKIQCHFCGDWFDTLQHHIHREHNMTAAQYKASVGLNNSTALINEKIREKLVAKGIGRRIKNLRPGGSHSKKTREKISQTLRENRLERKNITGTCPEQLLERLIKLHDELGRTPFDAEIPFLEALKRTYGSTKEAYQLAGLPYKKPVKKVKDRGAKEKAIWFVREFFEKENRFPKGHKEIPRKIYSTFERYGKKDIFKEAVYRDGIYKKTGMIFRHTKPELLEFLRTFKKINGRKPSYSDCKRGLLPHLSRYSYNFGSWRNALNLAFPE